MDRPGVDSGAWPGKTFISASDLAEYSYCSTQWYMDKMGYQRDERANTRMVTGRQMHQELGTRTRNSRSILRIGSLLLLVSIVLLVIMLLA
ncbi:MAG: hypothetical protein M1533_00825 [Candidatus Thermoplasmatota archaeon]|jgi:CRISPR/Cas system-associated exonuclease Cas4 (RecB family)|nr:hypothetical protein [Candidatus Thermoplasmatota archaeon]MCL5794362.1 hypothetical protein [Candidatus Thermoplasmatota archaeon]